MNRLAQGSPKGHFWSWTGAFCLDMVKGYGVRPRCLWSDTVPIISWMSGFSSSMAWVAWPHGGLLRGFIRRPERVPGGVLNLSASAPFEPPGTPSGVTDKGCAHCPAAKMRKWRTWWLDALAEIGVPRIWCWRGIFILAARVQFQGRGPRLCMNTQTNKGLWMMRAQVARIQLPNCLRLFRVAMKGHASR